MKIFERITRLRADWYDNLSDHEQYVVWEYISWGFTALVILVLALWVGFI